MNQERENSDNKKGETKQTTSRQWPLINGDSHLNEEDRKNGNKQKWRKEWTFAIAINEEEKSPDNNSKRWKKSMVIEDDSSKQKEFHHNTIETHVF